MIHYESSWMTRFDSTSGLRLDNGRDGSTMQEIKVLSLSFKPIKTSSRLLPICLQTIRALDELSAERRSSVVSLLRKRFAKVKL